MTLTSDSPAAEALFQRVLREEKIAEKLVDSGHQERASRHYREADKLRNLAVKIDLKAAKVGLRSRMDPADPSPIPAPTPQRKEELLEALGKLEQMELEG